MNQKKRGELLIALNGIMTTEFFQALKGLTDLFEQNVAKKGFGKLTVEDWDFATKDSELDDRLSELLTSLDHFKEFYSQVVNLSNFNDGSLYQQDTSLEEEVETLENCGIGAKELLKQAYSKIVNSLRSDFVPTDLSTELDGVVSRKSLKELSDQITKLVAEECLNAVADTAKCVELQRIQRLIERL